MKKLKRHKSRFGTSLLEKEKYMDAFASLKKFISSYRNKKNLVLGTFILISIIGFAVIYRAQSFFNTISTSGDNWTPPIPKEQKVFNILVLGYGGLGHDGAYLTDTIMFASVDTENHRITLVSIPRDLWVEIPTEPDEDYFSKINSAYQIGIFKDNYPGVPDEYGGPSGASKILKEVVGSVIGEPIDNYIAIDFDGFRQVVDTLGGVEVNVERPFEDTQYPIDGNEDDLCGLEEDDAAGFAEKELIATDSPEIAYPCRYEHLVFNAGTQLMDGATALKFVRSRHSPTDGGDFNRARRQQLFLEAVRDRVLSISFIPKILPLIEDLENNIRTDMSVDFMQKMLKEAPNAKDYQIEQIVLSTDNYLDWDYSDDGQYILLPNEKNNEKGNEWEHFRKDLKLMQEGQPVPTMTLTPTPRF